MDIYGTFIENEIYKKALAKYLEIDQEAFRSNYRLDFVKYIQVDRRSGEEAYINTDDKGHISMWTFEPKYNKHGKRLKDERTYHCRDFSPLRFCNICGRMSTKKIIREYGDLFDFKYSVDPALGMTFYCCLSCRNKTVRLTYQESKVTELNELIKSLTTELWHMKRKTPSVTKNPIIIEALPEAPVKEIKSFGDARHLILQTIVQLRDGDIPITTGLAIAANMKVLNDNIQCEINATKLCLIAEERGHNFGKVVGMGQKLIGEIL
jgi:hypothetical protein